MGTTWLFNVLQAVCEASSFPVAIVADRVEVPPAEWTGAILLKSHRADAVDLITAFDSRLPLMACVMVRDAVPTFRSLVRTQTADRAEVIGWLERDLTTYEAALPSMRHVAVIREEWVQEQAPDIVRSLAQFLALPLPPSSEVAIAERFSRAAVRKVVEELDQQSQWSGDFRHFDRESQWHAGHIAPDDQPEIELSPAETERLGRLQRRIDRLATGFPLWEASPLEPGVDATVAPMAFVLAREGQLHEPPGLWAKVRHAIGPRRS